MNVSFEHGERGLSGTLRPGDVPRAAVVFLHGSGPATADVWSEWATELAERDIASLAYDKPSDWMTQSFDDRAREAVAAVKFVRSQTGVPAGVLGMSQGAWIGPHAASLSHEISFVVALSGSGVGPRRQDRFRVEHQLRADGFSENEIADALAAWDQCDTWLRSGASDEDLIDAISAFRDRSWFAYFVFSDPTVIPFGRLIWDYDPMSYLERCRCPLLAIWGGRDEYVDAEASQAMFERVLSRTGNHDFDLRIVSGANHGLRNVESGERPQEIYNTIGDWIARTAAPQSDRAAPG